MKLSEATELLVEQAKFKKWFGKSVLRDENDKPHTFYHGTSSDFSEFNSGSAKSGNQWGKGIYFIKSHKIASDYATGETTGAHARGAAPEGNAAPNVMPVHLRMEKPFVMDEPLTKQTVSAVQNHLDYNLKDHLWNGMKNRDLRQHLHMSSDQETANGILQKAGFDGLKEKSDDSIHMVFHPNQVKSAIGNNGNYSKTSNNITESK
jgi:hypothetical protein